MKTTRKGFLFVVALRHLILPAAVNFALEAQAQFTGNNQTNIISGVTSNWSGNYYVGSNYMFDALLIQSGGVLSNAESYIGYTTAAKSNLVIVSGSGSIWKNTNAVHIGESGAGNRLVVTRGGTVFGVGIVGYKTNASNNSVLVTDSGSVWNGGMFVGNLGAGNSLVISNGGAIAGSFGSSVGGNGNASSFSASNNIALVTGSGSLWSNGTYLVIGNNANGNRLVISAGASVVSSNGEVGFNSTAGSLYFRSNSVLVTGSGSVWSNSDTLSVGTYSVGSSLVVSNGAQVLGRYGRIATVGGYGAVGNSVTVTGTGSVWSTSDSVSVGGARTILVVSNGGVVSAPNGYFAGNTNTVIVTGSGSALSNSSLYVGNAGIGCSLVITNGGKVSSYAGILGQDFSGSGTRSHSVSVTGSGSVWSNNVLYVGHSDSTGNSLTVSDGGRVISSFGYLGYHNDIFSSSVSNSVLVTGSGSVWSNRYDLYVGHSDTVNFASTGNSLVISNGGSVFDDYAFVGAAESQGGGSNSVLVTGSGSTWRNNHGLSMAGIGSALVISNGGCVSAPSVRLYDTAADRITVADGTLYVTNAGNGVLETLTGILSLSGGTITADNILALRLSVFAFSGGTLNSAGMAVTNTQQFIVGDGTNRATFHLLGGVHSFNDGLRIRTNSFLSGCGTINGSVVVDAGGTVLADCGSTLTFTGNVTNNGVMMADNGSVLESSGTLVNNGKIFLLNGATTNFHGTFINNGAILNAEMVLISNVHRSGNDWLIQIPSVTGFTYRLQGASSLQPSSWADSDPTQPGTGGVLTFTDPGAATNVSSRFYRVRVQ